MSCEVVAQWQTCTHSLVSQAAILSCKCIFKHLSTTI